MSNCVLDSSAILAYLHREPGHEAIGNLLEGAAVSAVNVAEVGTKLADNGASETGIRRLIRALNIRVVSLDEALAYRIAALRLGTRAAGLSLGDRACLATAQSLGVRAVTADRTWSRLKVEVEIQFIR